MCGLSGVQRLEIVVQDVNLRRILAMKNGKCAITPKIKSDCGVVLGYRLVELDVVRVGVRGVKTEAAKVHRNSFIHQHHHVML